MSNVYILRRSILCKITQYQQGLEKHIEDQIIDKIAHFIAKFNISNINKNAIQNPIQKKTIYEEIYNKNKQLIKDQILHHLINIINGNKVHICLKICLKTCTKLSPLIKTVCVNFDSTMYFNDPELNKNNRELKHIIVKIINETICNKYKNINIM